MPPADESERQGKEWLDKFTRPAGGKAYVWLSEHALYCYYEGQQYRVSGASRLGDIWLVHALKADVSSYDKRVDVNACSGWRMENITNRNIGADR
jgi:hypothetical protein